MSLDTELWLSACEERERYGPPEPMNVFYLDDDPAAAARAHCDSHVVKMILETAQLLSGAWHVLAPDALTQRWHVREPADPAASHPGEWRITWYELGESGLALYRPTHTHHPCAEWVRENRANYDWLWRLGMALLDEYAFRYPKRRHATGPVMWALEAPPPKLRAGEQSEPPCAMPQELIVTTGRYADAVASYRNYYRTAKRGLLRYTRREPPEWCRDIAQFNPAL